MLQGDEEEPLPPAWVFEEEENETAPLVSKDSTASTKNYDDSYDAVAIEEQSDNDEDDEGPKAPRKNIFLHIFGLLEMFAIVACTRMSLMQLLPFLFVPLKEIGFLQIATRFYVVLSCFVFILVELEVPIAAIQEASLLQNYISRGFLYSFLGLIGEEESYAMFVQELKAEQGKNHQYELFHISWETLLIKGASFIMIELGVIYMLLGIFCMRGVREGLRERHREAMERYREAKRLHEQKIDSANK